MSLTRTLLRGLGIEDDKIGTIIEAHTETINSLKQQRDDYKEKAEKYDDVQKDLDELRTLKAGDWQKKYEKEHSDFEAYKTAQESKESNEAKATAYKALLKDAGVSEKAYNLILKGTDLSALTMDKDGKLEKVKELTEAIEKDYADFITSIDTKGAKTKKQPSGGGGGTMTKDEIMEITDSAKRQQAIADNPSLFGLA